MFRRLTAPRRAKEIELVMQDDKLSEQKKEQKLNHIRKAEAQYLRFLRTRERPENFQTIKIIGKGAFGEVKLVQRRNDGKIYALKSLVKSEMVSDEHAVAPCAPTSSMILTNSNSLRRIS